MVNSMDRVLLAGRRHGDVTVNGIRALGCSMGLHEPPRRSNRGYISFCLAESDQWKKWKTLKNLKLGNFRLSMNSRENERRSLSAVAEGFTIFPSAVVEGWEKSLVRHCGRVLKMELSPFRAAK